MRERTDRKYLLPILWLGDVVTLVIVTAYGFSTHGELAKAGTRVLATFIPLLIAWMLVALPCKILQLSRAFEIRDLWRPVWAVILAAPLAGLIRAFWLGNRPIIPVFIMVLMGVTMVAVLIWRLLFLLLFKERVPK